MSASQLVRRCAPVLFLPILVALAVGCGGDSDSPTGPNTALDSTHFEMTVQMSSIWAQNDCENTPGNPGDFRWRLIVRKPDEFGNLVQVHDTGTQSITISDGDRTGVVMEPVRFLVPRAADSSFEVEFWVGEYDPSPDFERHGWGIHKFDRGKEQQWAAGTDYESDSYKVEEDGSGHGLYKFAVWNTRAECSGAAYYYVTWTPATP